MTNFDHEVRERAGLARSARCKKASVKGPRGCSLPSDNLTAAQKKKLNGPVEVHRLDKPMTLAEFRTLPDDLQGNYIRILQTEFGSLPIPDAEDVTVRIEVSRNKGGRA